MAYSTSDDLALTTTLLLDLADDDDNGEVDAGVVEAAIERADRRVDAYLRGRYELPFDPVPKEVVEISASLAVYYLLERRQITPPEGVKQRRDDAMTLLKDLQSGRASLDETGQASDLDRKPGRIVTNRTAGDKMFSTDVLNRF